MRLQDAAAFELGTSTKKDFNFVAATLVITFIYVVTGKLASLLALPPGYAIAIFPPAGIAVGAAFIRGRSSLIGVFLGSLLLNIWISHASTHVISLSSYVAAVLIATASALQAGIGGWLLRRLLGYPCAFDKARDISAFLLLSPLICLISASLSVASLLALGLFDSTNAMANWLTWWLGDTMGVLIMLPIVMVAIGEPRSLWLKRKYVITVPLAIAVALFVLAFIQASRWEEFESLNYLRTQIGWQSWTVLTLGLFGTGLMGALLMLSSGHSARVGMEVEQHLQALRESEQRWQFALEDAGDGLWDIDLDTGEMFLPRQTMAVLGYEGEAGRINIDEWKRRMYPHDLARASEVIGKCLAGETVGYIVDFRTLTGEGQWRWLRSRGTTIGMRPDGRPARLIGTYTDIESEKHSALKERLHSEVMAMLASAQGNHKLTDVLEKVTQVLQEANADVIYAVFTAQKNHFSMSAGSGFPADWRAREIPFDDQLQSGGTAIQARKIVEVSLPASVFRQQLAELASSAGCTLCWVELLQVREGDIDGALIAFNCKPNSAVLPDLDHVRHATRLLEQAIRRKQVDEQLQLAASVYETSSEAIVVVDADHLIEAVNPAFTAITGFSAEEVIGQGTGIFRNERDADAFDAVTRQVDATGTWTGELWSNRKSGEAFPLSVTINTVYDESGNFFRRVCVFSDITEKKIAEGRLQHLASHDSLTELPNRALFRDRLQQALAFAQRESGLLALMYIDLDHFKPVNDNLGHLIGDQLLHAAAGRMQACVRESDTVARIGGDEFVVLLPVIKSTADILVVAEKIRISLNEMFEISSHRINISASIGIAVYPDDGSTEHELALFADRAMYLAKQSGRNAIKS